MTRCFLASACALALFVGATLAAGAADLKVAVVDMGKVTQNYTALQERSKALQEWFNSKQDYLRRLSDFLLLSADNFNEVVALLNAPAPLPADKQARLKELSDLAASKEKAYHDLESKPNRTAQEDEAYKSMGDQYDSGQQRMAAEQAKLSADYNQQVTTARDGFRKKVEEVAAGLAKDEGFGLVLDTDMVLFGGTDITDKILAKLNGR
jgi:Skp family chaperone for outer membrane proteins